MKLVCVCGHFGGNQEQYDGQTVKTKSIYREIEKKFGSKEVLTIDTYNWKKHPLKLFFKCLNGAIKAENIIILPAHKGVKVFVPMFNILNFFLHKKLHYIVIGGWLPNMIIKDKFLHKQIKKVNFLYVETKKMKESLNELKIKNVYLMKNFKNLKILVEKRNIISENEKYDIKCCIFSRIEKEKGINDAVNVISKLNEEKYNIKLEIYGKVKKEYEEEFYKIISGKEYVEYKGVVESNRSTEVLNKYDFLLFPTRYKTEGIPGTIIDAYFSGLPVIASRWEGFEEVVIEGKTGFGYEILNLEDLYEKLVYVLNNLNVLTGMKENCLNEAKKYTADNAMKILYKNLEG